MKEKNKKFYRNKNKLNNKYKKKKKKRTERIGTMTDLARKLNNLEITLYNTSTYALSLEKRITVLEKKSLF